MKFIVVTCTICTLLLATKCGAETNKITAAIEASTVRRHRVRNNGTNVSGLPPVRRKVRRQSTTSVFPTSAPLGLMASTPTNLPISISMMRQENPNQNEEEARRNQEEARRKQEEANNMRQAMLNEGPEGAIRKMDQQQQQAQQQTQQQNQQQFVIQTVAPVPGMANNVMLLNDPNAPQPPNNNMPPLPVNGAPINPMVNQPMGAMPPNQPANNPQPFAQQAPVQQPPQTRARRKYNYKKKYFKFEV